MDQAINHARKLGLVRLALRGKRTEIDLALEPPGNWRGGTQFAFDGSGFHATFPVGGMTANVASSGSHGHTHINRPLTLAGKRISGLDLSIQDGIVTVESAGKNGDLLREFLDHSPRTRQLAAVSLPVSGHFPAPRNEAFCNPMMDATTAFGLTLTDPATSGVLRFDLFFDDDLKIEGTDAGGTVHRLDELLGAPDELRAEVKK